uniref:LBH domain-containing protein n=1 Tax=Oryzias melastigma TaxID=30732 RepID=A0A3B3CD59_ORYME
ASTHLQLCDSTPCWLDKYILIVAWMQSYLYNFVHPPNLRERLPSIVVEPTECSEQESEGPPWPLYPLSKDEEGEDSGAEPAEGATDGEHLEDMQEGSELLNIWSV